MKKLIIVLLLASLLLGICCTGAAAEETEGGKLYNAEGYVYLLKEDGTAEIQGYTGGEKKLEIPAQLDGHPVTALGGRAFYKNKSITEVTVPDTVKEIGRECFYYCTSLSSVALPEGLQRIGFYAFRKCLKLKKINIPDTVSEIEDGAFSQCKALKEIELSPDHPLLALTDGVLFNKADSVLLWYPAAKKEKEYSVSEGIKRIGDCAFSESRFQQVVLPESLETLTVNAFDECSSLKTVNIPPKVTDISGAFFNCKKLESLTVDGNSEIFESVDGVLFDRNNHTLVRHPAGKKEKTYSVPEGTRGIASAAFEWAGFTEIVIPGSVQKISGNAFLYCKKLKEIVLPEGVETLGNYSFQHCAKLKKVTLPNSLKSIGENPFHYCYSLEEIVIADDHPVLMMMDRCLVRREDRSVVTGLADPKAKQYEVPAGILKIGWSAFDTCTKLEELILPEGLTVIDECAFRNSTKLKRVVLPASLTAIDKMAFPMNSLKKTVFVVTPGSYAESFCQAYGLTIEYAQ